MTPIVQSDELVPADAPPAPVDPRCATCQSTHVQTAYSTITGRWWVLCLAAGCRHYAPATGPGVRP